jgi:hypothetical protein
MNMDFQGLAMSFANLFFCNPASTLARYSALLARFLDTFYESLEPSRIEPNRSKTLSFDMYKGKIEGLLRATKQYPELLQFFKPPLMQLFSSNALFVMKKV